MDLPIKDIDLSTLPPDIAAAIRGLIEITKRQEALIQELHQALYGKKSEKLSEDERQLVFEDLEVTVSEVESECDTAPVTPPASPKKRRPVNRNIGNLLDHLPRVEEVIEPESLDCPCGCGVAIVARTNGANNDDCTRSVRIAANGWISSRRNSGSS